MGNWAGGDRITWSVFLEGARPARPREAQRAHRGEESRFSTGREILGSSALQCLYGYSGLLFHCGTFAVSGSVGWRLLLVAQASHSTPKLATSLYLEYPLHGVAPSNLSWVPG